MKNQRPEKKDNRQNLCDKHIISVKYLDSIIPKVNEIIADSLEDALAFAKNLDDNPNRGYVIYDRFQRIVASKLRDGKKEYKHQKEQEKKQEKEKEKDREHEGHGHGHGHHHGHHHGHDNHDDDDDDMYA